MSTSGVIGFDGRDFEYCPYNDTSKEYDNTRAPLGLNIVMGAAALSPWALGEQEVLDVGCGTGTFIEAVHGKFGKVTGLEYNDGMIAQARARLGAEAGNVELVQGSADSLPFPDGKFHVVTINQVVHHFPAEKEFAFLQQCFKECSRVLKPGGCLVLNTSAPEQQRDAFWWLALFPEASASAICGRFPPLVVVKDQMKKAGLRVDADSICVPLERTLMAESAYLKEGVKSAYSEVYRAGDSSWSMAERLGELEAGLEKLRQMEKEGTAEAFLQEREKLRKKTGQATFVVGRK